MTMTSMAVAPGNLGAPPAMLAPKVYTLQQQGLTPTTTYPTTGKQQESLSKGKKSWSVRLGLSRHGQTQYDDAEKGWGTVSGGSALSRQMVYADPWLYGTVRSSRPVHGEPPPRAHLTGAPILIVCSCPEFLAGTVRKHGNCHKCGGRRLTGVPVGGTCRLPPSSVRSRPSLTGVLRPASDDPYDLMRRYRLVEPRLRARSTSPLRLVSQRDNRNQVAPRSVKDRPGPSPDLPYVRPTAEWHNNDSAVALGNSTNEVVRGSRANFATASSKDDWLEDTASESHQRGTNSSSSRLYGVSKKSRDALNDWPQLQGSSCSSPPSPSPIADDTKPSKNAAKTNDWKEETGNSAADSRRSILECDVNPYLLLKKQKDEDDSSDDLSDNALERDDVRLVSSLFDPTKVKSIERIPNRSAFAAIGGQKIRVFNEPREISDDEDIPPISRIPIPKVSPKRPPRRLKEARQTLKSILKRGKVLQDSRKRKNVLFNVDNVIFAPEKPPNAITSTWARIGKIAKDGFSKDWRSVTESDEELDDVDEEREEKTKIQEVVKVEKVEDEDSKVKEEHASRHQDRHKFITIPNIKDPKVDKAWNRESSGNAQTRRKISSTSAVEGTRHEKPVSVSKTNYEPAGDKRNSRENGGQPTESRPALRQNSVSTSKVERSAEPGDSKDKTEVTKTETGGVVTPEPIIRFSGNIPLDARDLILKTEENSKKSFLSRSQSDRTFLRSHVSTENANFMDTMRLGFSRKIKSCLSPVEFIENNTENQNENNNAFTEETQEVDPENMTIAVTNETIKEETVDETVEANLNTTLTNSEPFRRMRPTSWSPPPLRQKHRHNKRMSDPSTVSACTELSLNGQIDLNDKPNDLEVTSAKIDACARNDPSEKKFENPEVTRNDLEDSSNKVNNEEGQRRSSTSILPSETTSSWGSKECRASARIEVKNTANPKNNVCKITVSPRASPMVHRLQVGASPSEGSRRTSILINTDQNSVDTTRNSSNRVTISVGGEDSVCNPTVISVNTESPKPKIQSPVENRTLVILENHRSNIVVESVKSNDVTSSRQSVSFRSADVHGNNETHPRNSGSKAYVKKLEIEDKAENQSTVGYGRSGQEFSSLETDHYTDVRDVDENSDFGLKEKGRSSVEMKSRTETKDSSVQDRSGVTKEALISKLLGDSLKKARDKGEIPDEGSDEAILKILKQSLLKGKEYESSESTIEANYSRSSSANSVADADLVSTNLFFDENPYEVIKEPIYEEIPDEPPPLPLSPPPTEDFLKGYLGEISYYKKIGSYLSDDVFSKSNSTTDLADTTYLSKSPEEFFKKSSTPSDGKTVTAKFELLNFLMDSKDRAIATGTREDDGDDEDEEEEEDAERDLEALYEQKETSLGDLSSKSSQISNVSDSSEECNIILISPNETAKSRTVDIERTDSGVGSESSQASSTRGVARRWRTANVTLGAGSLGGTPQVTSNGTKLCEDCEQRLDPLITDSGVVYAPFVCRKCSKKRAERKEIITEIVETEQKYGRDLQIILEEFHRPMLRAGLLTSEQLSAIFLNVEELLEHNLILAQKLKLTVERAQQSGDEDLVTVDVGKIFLESERMLHAFESYCTRQGGASLLLQNLEKEKELLRIFLKVSQMENTVLRRMNLNSFLMVPVQRVTKYPLLLARLLKATPSIRPDIQEAKERLEQAQANIELHLEHMNAEAKDVTSTKLWRRISIIQNGRRPTGEQDMVNIKLRKMAVEVLEWPHEEARFVVEGRLLVAQPTDNNWRRGRTVKLAPVTAMLVTNGKANVEHLEFTDDSLFPKHIGIKEATLLLVKEKLGRYSLLREPLYLDKCIVCCETDFEDYFEIQELSSKETFIFKAEDGASTKRWCRMLQAHAQSLGAWRKRRGALPNIMICGVARN